ncbi:MAG: thiamine phosphate synthase [Deltaproteobacteria bacterium]|nr:thiamine phosphate synthase [Deltaproteobacteria bacterium]
MLIASVDLTPDLPRAVSLALSAIPRGGAVVQLREKAMGAGDLLTLARKLRSICVPQGAPLLLNERCDVALAADLDGVHLPAHALSARDARALLGPDALIGASCHSQDEVARALRDGADLAVYGPVFDTPGKGPAQGLAALSQAAHDTALPLFALGGIDASNAESALLAGARGVACQRAVLGAPDPAAAARALWASLALAGPL